jgi:hypothetical protein
MILEAWHIAGLLVVSLLVFKKLRLAVIYLLLNLPLLIRFYRSSTFHLIINDIFLLTAPCIEIYLYADDTAVVFSVEDVLSCN